MLRRRLSWVTCALLTLAVTGGAVRSVQAQEEGLRVCFVSAQGPTCIERPTAAATLETAQDGEDLAERLLRALLAGPTAAEARRGLSSAIPPQTTLASVFCPPTPATGRPPRFCPKLTVQLNVPPAALAEMDYTTVEHMLEQIRYTLEPVGWRELYVKARDPQSGLYRPLSEFLPELPLPRKETPVAVEAEGASPALLYSAGETSTALEAPPGQPPAYGQGQPTGALSGKTVYVSAGHGWLWNDSTQRWRTQRPPYPTSPYVGPIIEDHNNAEAVNQYLLQYLWNAGAMVWTVRERDMNAFSTIVNNDLPGVGNSYTEEGLWYTGSAPGYDPKQSGHTYRYALTVDGPPTTRVTWTASVPADGRYALYVWFLHASNRPPDARYIVYHAGGQTEVRVNQTKHGQTWHYIGTYTFRASEGVRVTLDNSSSVAGRAVIADALRVGGGTFNSLAGIQTSAPYAPNKPWWESGAYYYVQRQGYQPGSYFNDIVARPMYARWEHAESGDDAVYVSWHTNGYSGYQTTYRGTESYIHNGATYPATEGSAALRNAIHTELIRDLRAGWDPTWVDRGQKSADLGELRLLWDPDPEVRMPGTLIEIAYHDHPSDTDALKDPRFEMLVARAIYQGIVKYFEQRDRADLTLLPEPPTHLRVTNLGDGQVVVRWQPSPVDSLGLGGDPATAYRVYTSTDGLGWSNGVPVPTTAYTITGLTAGQLLFVRVTATNAGGESFPSEVLGARVGHPAGVLLVNGFDRIDRFGLIPETDAVEGRNMRMFLDRINRYDYAVNHGTVIPYLFDSASNEAVADGLVNLQDYRIVDWILGEEGADETLSTAERAALRGYLDGGGALFISGTELAWDLDYRGRDPAFYNQYLKADYVGDDANTYEVVPVAGSIFDGLGPFRFDAPAEYDADSPDRIAPYGGSQAALSYPSGTGGTAAVQHADGCRRIVNFGFPFETIHAGFRPAVMSRVLDFLDECLPLHPETIIVSPQDNHGYREVPPLQGSAYAPQGIARVEVSLRREQVPPGEGAYWSGSSWVDEAWHTAQGTTAWSFPMPPTLPLGGYIVQARAWDTQGLPDPSPASARFAMVRPQVALPLVLRDFGEESPQPQPPTCTDIVINGGFEDTTGWTIVSTAYPAGYTTERAYSGARSMRIGIPVGQPGGGTTTYSSVSQTLTLSAGFTPTLRYWVYPICQNDDPGDLQYVWLKDAAGKVQMLYTARENLNTWVERTIDLSAYAGQQVQLYFSVRNDGDNDVTVTYIDDVRVELCPR